MIIYRLSVRTMYKQARHSRYFEYEHSAAALGLANISAPLMGIIKRKLALNNAALS